MSVEEDQARVRLSAPGETPWNHSVSIHDGALSLYWQQRSEQGDVQERIRTFTRDETEVLLCVLRRASSRDYTVRFIEKVSNKRMRTIHTQDFKSDAPIVLWQKEGHLYITAEATIPDEGVEDVLITHVTHIAVSLTGSESHTEYQISGAAYWRAYHGSEEPDIIWSGVMEARATYERQRANAQEALLIKSVPILLSKAGLYCAFGPLGEDGTRQRCGTRAKLVHITEDLSRPGAFVILPICDKCNLERTRASCVDDGAVTEDEVLLSTEQVQQLAGAMLYPIGEEG